MKKQIITFFTLLLKLSSAILLSLVSINVSSAITNQTDNSTQKYQSNFSITSLATKYALTQMPDDLIVDSVSPGSLNSFVKLKLCQQGLKAFSPGTFRANRNFTVGVKCQLPRWKIYVPMKAAIFTHVITSKQTILKDQVIEARHVALMKKKYSGGQKTQMTSLSDVIGKVAKRTIPSNTKIRANQLKINYLIKSKQEVTIIAKSKNFRVQMKGIALKHGHKNDIIKVRNSRSNKVVEAVIIRPGTVRVNF